VTRRGRLTLGLLVLAILGVAAGAWAYWTTHGTGSASANVGTLNAPTDVSVPSTASGAVHVTWTDSTLGDGVTPASGYYVTRTKNSDSSTANACGTSPSSLTSSTATSCDDTSVPDGTYHYTVTAVYRTWTATSAASGNVVSAATVDHFAVTAPANATAGTAFNVTVTAKTASNVTVTGYTGTVHFASSDSGSPVLPSNYAFTTGDGGSHTFTNGVTLKTAGSQTVTVNDAAETGKTGTATISVGPAGADHLKVTAPANATAGTAFTTVTLTAQDLYNNTATGYANGDHTITWSGASTSPNGTGPSYPTSTVSFTNGVSTTTLSTTLYAAGSNSLTASATSPSLTGTATLFVNSAGVALSYNRTCPVSMTHNTSIGFTINVPNDAYGNSFKSSSGIAIGLSLTGAQSSAFGFGTVGTTSTTVTITTGPANNAFTVAESGNNKTATLTATAPSGFTPPGSCVINAT
jgi:hypothetical protein